MAVNGRGFSSSNSQALLSAILVIFQLSVTTDASIADTDKQEALFYVIKTASLIGNVTMVKLTRNELDCALLCLRSHPHKCFSFNFGRNAVDDWQICELSNSERALEPHKMQGRREFDYFGMEHVYLSRFFPCLSSPCRNGGSCVYGPALEMFHCDCPLEIRVLPYIDNKCNVNHSLIGIGRLVKGVFFASVGRYQLNYFEAERLCGIHGATLASEEQLTAAWEEGLQQCSWGWLIDATAGYPMHEVRENCGNMTGIVRSGTVYDKTTKTKKFDAWCHRD